ncbi:LysR family transcriptional regulator [Atopomonas sediminilitoris]|uniref:LysR family transcriptional regulator n=1 Tax=Atopomonas sediminilitoris TaxID=2919919 RepID=UPI001F4EBAD1|nr:LysR family transcriptional regulator [Atopomonas sediminilitoris]MCJ8169153.1 LysR family transcriptional regulator [Atopomonas sediminilitoris]
MTRDIDISLIRTFLAVAESGGMTPAAQALNLTQGAVSQKIQRLEALFETVLFERYHRTIRLTADGERLMSRAYRLISLNDETWQFMTRPEFTGEIKLGVPLDIIRPMLPSIMRRFSREHPKIQLTLICDVTETLLARLKQGEVDLTLTTESVPGKEGTLLLRDNLVWIGAPNGEACWQKPLPVSLGSEFCAFRGPTLKALDKATIDWLAVCNVGNLESILATVEADMAVAPYLSSLIPANLSIVSAEAGLPPLPAHYINLRLPDSGGSLIAQELANYIRQGFASVPNAALV